MPVLLILGCALAVSAFAQQPAAPPPVAAAPAPAAGLEVADFVEVLGAQANPIRGYGVVAGLSGTGDSPGGATAALLRQFLSRLEGEPVPAIASRSVALVAVEAEMAPFQRPGTRLDVRVSALGDARSLEGGELVTTYLRAREGDDRIMAVARGAVAINSPQRPLTGIVPGGAIVQTSSQPDASTFARSEEWTFTLVGTDPQSRALTFTEVRAVCRAIRLVLKRPNHRMAEALADRINAEFLVLPAVEHALRDLRDTMAAATGQAALADQVVERLKQHWRPARAVDWGTILVRIPHPEVEWRHYTGGRVPYPEEFENPFRFVTMILSVRVDDPRRGPPMVVVNQAAQSIAITGTVRCHAGVVRVGTPQAGGGTRWVRFTEGADLASELERFHGAFSASELIEVVLKAHEAGLIEAEVIAR